MNEKGNKKVKAGKSSHSIRKKKTDLRQSEQNTSVEELEKETEEVKIPVEEKSEAEDGCKEKEQEIKDWKKDYDELYDKYLRLYSEFENFRRRTNKEKIELIDRANESLILELLDILDDFERALKSLESVGDINGTKDRHLARNFNLFYVGDRVIQTENNYDKEIFNGDMGKVESVGRKVVNPQKAEFERYKKGILVKNRSDVFQILGLSRKIGEEVLPNQGASWDGKPKS